MMLREDYENPALDVKIEPRDSHDRVKEIVLIADKEVRENIGRNPLSVETRPEAVILFVVAASLLELSRVKHVISESKEWHVLDIRVMLYTVAYNVVHIVRMLPPSKSNSAQGVAKKDAKEYVVF